MQKRTMFDISINDLTEQDFEALESMACIDDDTRIDRGLPHIAEHNHGFIIFCTHTEDRFIKQRVALREAGFTREFEEWYINACKEESILINFDTY